MSDGGSEKGELIEGGKETEESKIIATGEGRRREAGRDRS